MFVSAQLHIALAVVKADWTLYGFHFMSLINAKKTSYISRWSLS